MICVMLKSLDQGCRNLKKNFQAPIKNQEKSGRRKSNSYNEEGEEGYEFIQMFVNSD